MSALGTFERAAARLVARDDGVERGRMLHAPGLKARGKFFAFATADDVVVKLPAERVCKLIAAGEGSPCVISKGSPLREWVRLVPADAAACGRYLREARTFVGAARG